MIEAMVDNETWGIRTTSVVRSCGIVVFDGPTVLNKLYFRLSETEQVANRGLASTHPVANGQPGFFMPGRTLDRSTIDWWAKPENAVAQATINDAPLVTWDEARAMYQHVGVQAEAIWAKPGMFDLPMLRDLFGQDIWPYWKERDLSTLLGEFDPGRTTKPTFTGTPHNALDDALHAHEWLITLRRAIPVVLDERRLVRTFDEAWAEMVTKGYEYGPDALEQVRFGWNLARGG